MWNQKEAIELCAEIEKICPLYGCHVALTGGCLYKYGERKDLDILFYRIRQVPSIDYDGLFKELSFIGVHRISGFGWCYKAEYKNKKIDCFFPEEVNGEYVSGENYASEIDKIVKIEV
ncbi:MAG: hypothetical protein WC901_00890 [Candidatus Margulisiibacteriota bacterium]